nr:quinol oxidase subunit 4 [uncultured Pedobacter sp.]
MKKIYFVLTICSMMFLMSCYTQRTAGNSGKVPPGQEKKRTGSKSAKPYAPGQQKKN